MKLKYKVRQTSTGKWAIWANKKEYFAGGDHKGLYETEADAIYCSLLREGQDLVEKLDDLQTRLESTGRIRASDPYGWRS